MRCGALNVRENIHEKDEQVDQEQDQSKGKDAWRGKMSNNNRQHVADSLVTKLLKN